ncbi:MAG: hypothetical protein NTZ33_06230 [Bacteroidetes bacterium]|nr:hypothetical protein [Bacteroidota bacterium]
MLIKTEEIQAFIQMEASENLVDFAGVPSPDISPGYIKYGLYSRKSFFFHAYYKAFNMEDFKANIANAGILADILSNLLLHFLPCPAEWCIITTPKRKHFDMHGYHFASEILKLVAAKTAINFLPDIIQAKSRDKINTEFVQIKPLPATTKLILYDDILTTGRTIISTLEVLKSNPENQLTTANIPVIIGINNN